MTLFCTICLTTWQQDNSLNTQTYYSTATKHIVKAIISPCNLKTWQAVVTVVQSYTCSQSQLMSWQKLQSNTAIILKNSEFNVNKTPTDATVCRYLFTAKLLYMFRVSQHPSSGVLKTVPVASSTGHTTCTATSLRGLIGRGGE